MARRAGQSDRYIAVHGLVEFQRAMVRADRTLAKQIRAANKDVAQFAADKAKANAMSLSPAAARTLAPTFRAKGGRFDASVRLGMKTDPFPAAAGWEYGSRNDAQFPLPFVSVRAQGAMSGYALGKALRDNRDEIEQRMVEAVMDMWERDVAAIVNRAT